MKTLLKLLMTLIVFVIIVWSSKTTSISRVVTINEIRSDEIVVETIDKEIKTLKINNSFENVIYANHKYQITYTEGRWGNQN